MQSVWAGQEGQATWTTLTGGLLLLWRGESVARGGWHRYSPLGVHDGPSGGGALAGRWAMGESEAAAPAPSRRRGDPAAGAALGRDRRQQCASPRHRLAPAHRDGLGGLAVSRGVRQRW